MTFIVHYGLHGAAAEEYLTPQQAFEGYRRLEQGGAKYLQVSENGQDVPIEELARRAGASGEAPAP
ncbi:hypothetical protein RCO27_01760 [Sphingosinicella sp. LHD-64]|uniref:hypothetical protein n=1 Tax=Sphingosinicella sp. LHD-64 TaxID=3072139 RepID=UPI0028104782|nr:hypothetical protein [Sphingosinicella sp. LHD-64]MDQ8754943.1 hypothetical protein [Sphingosinicella sp. LHD-64]